MTDSQPASGFVDWGLAQRVGSGLAGGENSVTSDAAARRSFAEALDRVLSYTGLELANEPPPVETVTRAEWIEANIDGMRELASPLEARAATELALPGPLGRLVRTGVGLAGGIEAGLVLGYAARRVLGQLQVALTAQPRQPRLLLVGGNVAPTARELRVDQGHFLLWVAIHEQTHTAQFGAVPWLRDHLAALVDQLISAASRQIDLSSIAALARRVVRSDPREALRAVLRGELARALAGPEQLAVIDELQSVMAAIEGYAEHVMDAAASDAAELAEMRSRLDARRARRGGLADAIARALGLGMKLRQYELGKTWSDAVAAEAGIAGLNRVWDGPQALPSAAELEQPQAWIERVAAAPSGSRP